MGKAWCYKGVTLLYLSTSNILSMIHPMLYLCQFG